MDILNLEAFRYQSGKLLVLDQLKLPLTNEYIKVENVKEGWEVINKMQVRSIIYWINVID
jgi:methylthioribose-1-phosphate isomerase